MLDTYAIFDVSQYWFGRITLMRYQNFPQGNVIYTNQYGAYVHEVPATVNSFPLDGQVGGNYYNNWIAGLISHGTITYDNPPYSPIVHPHYNPVPPTTNAYSLNPANIIQSTYWAFQIRYSKWGPWGRGQQAAPYFPYNGGLNNYSTPQIAWTLWKKPSPSNGPLSTYTMYIQVNPNSKVNSTGRTFLTMNCDRYLVNGVQNKLYSKDNHNRLNILHAQFMIDQMDPYT